MVTYFSRGEPAVLRALEQGDGFAAAMTSRIVEDGPDRTVVYWPAGTRGVYRGPMVQADGTLRPDNPVDLAGTTWDRRDVLRLMYPGEPYSIWLLWDVPDWSLTGWYTNLELPFRRTEIEFDYQDHELDVVVRPDFSWYWKDEDDLAVAVEGGVFSPEMATGIRKAGENAIARPESRDPPFNEPWPDWRPDPAWGPLELPEDWDKIPR